MSIISAGGAHRGSVRGFYPKTLEGSLRFNDDDSTYLSLEPTGTSGGRTKFTYSGWVKICEFSTANGFHLIHAPTPTANNLNGSLLYINGSNVFRAQLRTYNTGAQGAVDASYTSSMVFRDPSAWYHIVFAFDSTATLNSDETMRLWVNGVLQTNASPDYPSASGTQYLGSEVTHEIGRWLGSSHGNTNGYMAEVFFIDGTVYEASDFGETKNGVWVPKNITATDFTMGTNGFYLNFLDDATVEAFNTVIWSGTNSGTNRSFTGTGFSPDLVWSKRRDSGDGNSNHQLYDTVRGARNYLASNSTSAEGNDVSNGVINSFDPDGFTWQYGTQASYQAFYYDASGGRYVAWCWDAGDNNPSTGHSSVTWQGDDLNNRVISGFPFTPDLIWIGPRTFSGANKQIYDSVRGFGIGKDLISNGISAEGAESPAYGGIDSATRYGFKTKSGSSGGGLEDAQINMYQNGTYYPGITGEYVAWAWDAGDGYPVTDTSGTNVTNVTRKTSTANGFSIIDYTVTSANNSATKLVPHGLGGNPDWMMIKKYTNNASDNQRWAVYHSGLADDQFLKLGDESTDGASTSSSVFDDSAFTTDTFAVGSSGMVGGHPSFDESYICYAWKAVSGKSAFGTYTGTGSSQTISTGFRVGWLMIKATSTSGQSWFMIDGSRSPFNNGDVQFLAADTSGVEQGSSVNDVDFHETDGFTVKGTGNLTNGNLIEYVYMAFKGSYSDYITDYNTDGTIDSRVKASTANGFSIVNYIGNGTNNATVAHGLGAVPDFVVVKPRDFPTATNWAVWHSNLGSIQYYLRLNTTDKVVTTDNSNFGSVDPTSTVMNLGYAGSTNTSTYNYIMYCWTDTSGNPVGERYSKFGSYSGSSSQVTIDVGFNPAFVLIKNTTSDGFNWGIFDNTRNTDGSLENPIYPNTSGAEETGYTNPPVTFDGNDILVRGGDNGWNNTGQSYIYAAFADTREAAFWLDQSGNNNDWQPVNLDYDDAVADSPTDNFATWNPLASTGSGVTGYGWSMSEGNMVFTPTNASGYNNVSTSTIAMTSGKFYFEFRPLGSPTSGWPAVGLCYTDSISTLTSTSNFQTSNDVSIMRLTDGDLQSFGSTTFSSYGNAISSSDVLMLAVDCDNGKVWWGENGAWFNSGNPTTGTNAGDTFTAGTSVNIFMTGYNSAGGVEMNCGQQPFNYDPPA